MKNNKKTNRITNLAKRRLMMKEALPEVRKLVAKYDLASVQAAVKSLYDNRRAEQELKSAELKVAELKRKLG